MIFSIILPAYKEKDINKVLALLLKQPLPTGWKLGEILVVACGYKNFKFLKHKKIKVIGEKKRSGKAQAINFALEKLKSDERSRKKSDVIIVQSSDTLPGKNMLKKLLAPFKNPAVGMSCGRPVSFDNPNGFVGFLNNLVWELHHLVSIGDPKVGEMFAFRNFLEKIPKKTVADEAYVESINKKMGYTISYVPDAIVFNKGPLKVSDFVDQRRRIFAGHVHIRKKYGYNVSTMNAINIVKAMFEYCTTKPNFGAKQFLWLFLAVLLEIYARLLGSIDFYVFKKVPYMWRVIKTAGR